MNIPRDASDFVEASYFVHPVEHIEPLQDSSTAGAETLLSILGFLSEANTTISKALRAEIAIHSIAPELFKTSTNSISARYNVSKPEIQKLSKQINSCVAEEEGIKSRAVFWRIFGWMAEGRTTTALAMRTDVVIHTLSPQYSNTTAASIASCYQVTRAEISKLAVGLRDAFPSANIQAPTQRNERTRQKCKTAQKQIVSKGLRKSWPSRITKLSSPPTQS